MTYRGRVKNGSIVLEMGPALPDGTTVDVHVAGPANEVHDIDAESLAEGLLKFAGSIELPPDASRTIDQYLYGDGNR